MHYLAVSLCLLSDESLRIPTILLRHEGHMATGSWQPLKLPQLRRYSTASSGLDGLGDESSRKAWKEMEKAYGGSKEFKLRRGMARIPSIVNLSPTLPPASRMQKLKDLLLRVSSCNLDRNWRMIGSPYIACVRMHLSAKADLWSFVSRGLHRGMPISGRSTGNHRLSLPSACQRARLPGCTFLHL